MTSRSLIHSLLRAGGVPAALLLIACGEKAPGTLEVRIYGEEFIEEGIPASAFVDGWAVAFDKFLVSVGDISAASRHGAPAITDGKYKVFDLARGSGGAGHTVLSQMVPGGEYDHVSYRIKPAPSDATAGNTLDTGDREAMVAGGVAVRATGKATRADKTIAFDWSFPTKVLHRECHAEAVVDGNTSKTELTIHADHLFYDDLVATEPKLAFDLIAGADKDGDGTVTAAELRAVDITTQARYQVGSAKVTNLWDFIAAQVATVGHIDGEGHCEIMAE